MVAEYYPIKMNNIKNNIIMEKKLVKPKSKTTKKYKNKKKLEKKIK